MTSRVVTYHTPHQHDLGPQISASTHTLRHVDGKIQIMFRPHHPDLGRNKSVDRSRR